MEKSSFCSLEAFLVRKGKKGMPRSAPRASVSWDARGGGGGGGGPIGVPRMAGMRRWLARPFPVFGDNMVPSFCFVVL